MFFVILVSNILNLNQNWFRNKECLMRLLCIHLKTLSCFCFVSISFHFLQIVHAIFQYFAIFLHDFRHIILWHYCWQLFRWCFGSYQAFVLIGWWQWRSTLTWCRPIMTIIWENIQKLETKLAQTFNSAIIESNLIASCEQLYSLNSVCESIWNTYIASESTRMVLIYYLHCGSTGLIELETVTSMKIWIN